MSAFVGIVHFDDSAPAPGLIEYLTGSLARLGPDRQCCLVRGQVAFGHALLETDTDRPSERQPVVVDPDTLLVGDVRLDQREQLAAALGADLRESLRVISDMELVARAWRRWGESLVDRLAGDYSFAIWDARRCTLFAARDHFGIRTLYYHRTGGRLIFSNTLQALLHVPDVSRDLNEQAITDFLLFRHNLDRFSTSFASINQVGAAHLAVFESGSVRQHRYWTLPIEEPLRPASDEELVERFRLVFQRAVSDRLRRSGTGIMVSGGMDSTSVAVTALEQLREESRERKLTLFTLSDPAPSADNEHQHVARLATDLELEMHAVTPEAAALVFGRGACEWPAPEVIWHKWNIALQPLFPMMAQAGPVAFTGQGGDAVLTRSDSYFPRQARHGRWISYAREFSAWRRQHGRRPPLGIRAFLRRKFEPQRLQGIPRWIPPELAERLKLVERVRDFIAASEQIPPSDHPFRPEAYQSLSSPYWQYVLPAHDAPVTGQPLEFRHPFFDLRVVALLLRIDSPRWFFRKTLLRQAMHGRLPAYIGERPKQVQSFNDRRRTLLEVPAEQWAQFQQVARGVEQFVDRTAYDRMVNHLEALPPVQADQLTLPVILAQWHERVADIPFWKGEPGDLKQ